MLRNIYLANLKKKKEFENTDKNMFTMTIEINN